MPTSADILDEITDVTVKVLGCPAADITPDARFADLGSDSLTIVEIGEELGRRFGVRLSDDAIDTMRTVQDGINAVVDLAPESYRKDGAAPATASAATAGRPVATPASAATPFVRPEPVVLVDPPVTSRIKRKALGLVIAMAVVGVLVGGFFGFGLSAVVSAAGIDDVTLPPLPSASPSPVETEEEVEPTPEPEPTPTEDEPEEPTLVAEQTQVAPGQRFVLSGAFPEAGQGARLQVQVREEGTDWGDFPITTTTRDGGEFRAELFTSRPGEREFRMLDEESGDTSPTVDVTIG
ncbi:acyl carrier protein [Aeromicrobium sp. CF3.5]|uniref:acyl carrier protein n=1 Tax=Aeromicrobium sp. CF3.5 TaxID=3373078 RepID=UPI003EE68810